MSKQNMVLYGVVVFAVVIVVYTFYNLFTSPGLFPK